MTPVQDGFAHREELALTAAKLPCKNAAALAHVETALDRAQGLVERDPDLVRDDASDDRRPRFDQQRRASATSRRQIVEVEWIAGDVVRSRHLLQCRD
jgi:hypothetical protein